MTSDLPESITSGEPARLFPVLSESSKEGRALSVLLACLGCIEVLAKTLLSTVGQRVGTRTRVTTYTEVVLSNLPEDTAHRPDGLIVVETGKKSYTALVEAKVGRVRLNSEQLESYVKLARANGISALITISNEFTALPSHHPVRISRLPRGVQLFHWSWTSILTHSKVLLASKEVEDTEQRYLLNELVRFLDHHSSGVLRFTQMGVNWKEIVASVLAGADLSPRSDIVRDTIGNWHQECRDLALKLTRHVNSNIDIRLPRPQRLDVERRISADADLLCAESKLRVEYAIPDAVGPLVIEADLRTRSIYIYMTLGAPEDRKSVSARTNWLLRQLTRSDPKDLYVKAVYSGRRKDIQATLTTVREDSEALKFNDPSVSPKAFEIRLVRSAGGRFTGSRTFIEELESSVLRFYSEVGQRLKNWQPAAPKMVDEPSDTLSSEELSHSVEQANLVQFD